MAEEITVVTLPKAMLYATSTDLAGTDKERKQYFILIEDGQKRIRFSLHVDADGYIKAEPVVEHELDYWAYDGWDDPDEETEDDEEYWYYDDEDYDPDEDDDEEPPEEDLL